VTHAENIVKGKKGKILKERMALMEKKALARNP
jgi:hypothetical protein